MPITSKYSDKEIESILTEMTDVLKNHNVKTDMAIMLIGNMATNVLNHNVPASQRKMIAKSFADALLASVND
jgi:uncharacterized protein YejL (UPF0352 family)